jgi:hypothetical protein
MTFHNFRHQPITKILSVSYYAHFGLSCPEWQFNRAA